MRRVRGRGSCVEINGEKDCFKVFDINPEWKNRTLNNGFPLVTQETFYRVFWSLSWIKTSFINTSANRNSDIFNRSIALWCAKENFYWFVLNENGNYAYCFKPSWDVQGKLFWARFIKFLSNFIKYFHGEMRWNFLLPHEKIYLTVETWKNFWEDFEIFNNAKIYSQFKTWTLSKSFVKTTFNDFQWLNLFQLTLPQNKKNG